MLGQYFGSMFTIGYGTLDPIIQLTGKWCVCTEIYINSKILEEEHKMVREGFQLKKNSKLSSFCG